MRKEILKDFFESHIKGTLEKAIVVDIKVFLCHLTKAVTDGIDIDGEIKNVYVTSKSLKHLFDKKPAEEFFFLIDNLHLIVKYPDKIYKNKKSKRGDFCFSKKIGKEEYICSIEVIEFPPAIYGVAELGVSEFGTELNTKEIQIVTAFRLRSDKYIKNYTLLWDWGTGNPHRSALDTPEESTSAPQ